MTFKSILMNPPYSASWSADKDFLDDDRFKKYGKLAPKSKADFAFLLHGYHHLEEFGTMAIVLPHGVLFRGGSEGSIRKGLLEDGSIDSVIGLPANLFYGTQIPTTIIILKKGRKNKDVLFIDASNDFIKGKNQNTFSKDHIQKIVNTFNNREEIERYSHVATFEEIKGNDFNLNIPRYVDTFQEMEQIDIVSLNKEIIALDKQIEIAESDFLSMLDELAVTDESRDIIESTKAVFGRKNEYS